MATITPWMTASDLIESVKRKISFPISQNTFSENDILKFANEEMFISQVPSVLQFHEEYFVTIKTVPLQTNVSRYPIPSRATGMKLRDLFWMDQNGNLFEMTRIEEHDRAFFQRNVGANQAIHKFFLEGNYVNLTPSVVDSPTGSLVFVFYLRPNQIVKNGRAATISCFSQTISLNNSLIQNLDNVVIGQDTYTAMTSPGGSITSIAFQSSNSSIITSANHNLITGQIITITGSNSNPSVDGTYTVTVIDSNTFSIPIEIATSGTAGSYTCANQFQISVTPSLTTANLASSITNVASPNIVSAMANATTVTVCYKDIYTAITPSRTVAFIVPQQFIGVVFESLPSTYRDVETNVTEDLFQEGSLIDFLQTRPGHQTYVYDIVIPKNGISGNTITFNRNSLLVPTGTVNNSAGSTGQVIDNAIQYILAPMIPGDYICLANEAIIPQIPPDLHNGLAERTSARILAAIGDQQGLQTSMQKIAEIEQRQGNLLDNRSEGTPQKVANRHSLLHYGKMGVRRRF